MNYDTWKSTEPDPFQYEDRPMDDEPETDERDPLEDVTLSVKMACVDLLALVQIADTNARKLREMLGRVVDIAATSADRGVQS